MAHVETLAKDPRDRGPKRRRRFWILGIIALVAAGGIWQSLSWFRTPRASSERLLVQSMMRSVAQAAAIYKSDLGELPAPMSMLVRNGLFKPEDVRPFVGVEFRPDFRPDEPRIIAVQKEPCRAVAKGEPWGGLGEVTDRDLPAVRFALYSDLTVKPIPEDEFQARVAPHATLKSME